MTANANGNPRRHGTLLAVATTTIAAGDAAEEIDKLRRGGDGHIVVWGGARLFRGRSDGDDDRMRHAEATWVAISRTLQSYLWAIALRDMSGAFRALVEANVLLRTDPIVREDG